MDRDVYQIFLPLSKKKKNGIKDNVSNETCSYASQLRSMNRPRAMRPNRYVFPVHLNLCELT